jgi:hypothetical protein
MTGHGQPATPQIGCQLVQVEAGLKDEDVWVGCPGVKPAGASCLRLLRLSWVPSGPRASCNSRGAGAGARPRHPAVSREVGGPAQTRPRSAVIALVAIEELRLLRALLSSCRLTVTGAMMCPPIPAPGNP